MLSTTSQYALRALAFIAAQGAKESVLGKRISEETGIPRNYLSKILIGLNNAGIVSAVRGTGGGYRLTKSPRSIRLSRIVAVFDRDVVNPCCLLGYGRPCSDANACSAHFSWKTAREALMRFLKETSLADIAANPAPAVQARGVNKTPASRKPPSQSARSGRMFT